MARSYTWTPTADMVTKEVRVRVVAIADQVGDVGVRRVVGGEPATYRLVDRVG